MERTASVEDKIRRAEEIYYRRNEGRATRENIEIKPQKRKDIKLFKKMIKQIIICLIIYGVFYAVVNNNYVFSKDFTDKAREILSQDININEIYSIILNNLQKVINHNQEETNQNENVQEEVPQSENQQGENEQENIEDIQNNNENIGGAEEVPDTLSGEIQSNGVDISANEAEANSQTGETTELSQMEQDANYIKSTISFIKPVEGVISSKYGLRNPTTASVPKNHTGTDIAAETGTKIISATDGTVILASSQGDYGNHLKIQINDVIIVYAHCNKLYVNEGDTISQGQEIAEVGSTGNTTGPHLHFEVRYQDRTVDPQMILEL